MTLKTYSTSRSYIQVQPWGLIRINLTTRSYIKVLQKTSTLDLQTFPFQVNALAQLDLHDNLMGKIPFEPISHVKTLRILDLSNNRVEKVEDPFFSRETLKLDQLFLMDNSIETLPSNSFANFEFINYTTLSGNPLRIIEDGAFKVNKLLLIQDEKSSNHVMNQCKDYRIHLHYVPKLLSFWDFVIGFYICGILILISNFDFKMYANVWNCIITIH